MKRIFIFALALIILILSFTGCTKTKNKITDYQYMYSGIVKDWNRKASPGHYRKDLFGYGEYLYNSYLILFPRETPSTLKEYYFHWSPLMDVDGYAIYFTCKFESAEKFSAFKTGLENFEFKSGTATRKLLYDNEHFSYLAYIIQWKEPDDKWEVLEYIMLDEENLTAVFVYTMGELEYIEKNSSYTVTPTDLHFLEKDFSIYLSDPSDTYDRRDNSFADCTYDISFLQYLT